jgi:hypothetical protein
MLMRAFAEVALLGTLLCVGACGQDSVMPAASAAAANANLSLSTRSLADVTDAQWARLAQRTIFFGHQSVGRNIVQGIEELMKADPRIKLRIVRSPRAASVGGPAFVHFDIGENYDPASKDTAFVAALDGFDSSGGVAMYKYCFVDMGRNTDPDSLFAEYARTTDAMHAQHSNLTIVHITQPLLSATPTPKLKAFVKRLLGRGENPEVALNAKRNRFNMLLRERYGGKEPVFDLAAIESTHLDGSRSSFTLDGQTVYTLAQELTSDGGHLNELGRRRVSEQLLLFLTSL